MFSIQISDDEGSPKKMDVEEEEDDEIVFRKSKKKTKGKKKPKLFESGELKRF